MSSPKKIVVYKTFEEGEAMEIEETLKMTPEERIEKAVNLILQVYNTSREELRSRPRNRRITIIRDI